MLCLVDIFGMPVVLCREMEGRKIWEREREGKRKDWEERKEEKL